MTHFFDSQSLKQKYHKPAFSAYGDINTLTMANGTTGCMDNGSGTCTSNNNNRTSELRGCLEIRRV